MKLCELNVKAKEKYKKNILDDSPPGHMLSAVEKVALGPVAEGANASTQERAAKETIIEDFMSIIDL